ncbi:hypothetical protein [Catenuloplanes japonicus]|uniref:hypothetical protein n=1 Tax=Catenuloplanes japonicus TaxID=33876 RepID=UPI0005240672|nr:hypothetical protein [Catenuloplanes japonicus]
MNLPDLRTYRLHRTLPEADFEGVPVPGLHAEFYRRPVGDRIASVGRYSYNGRRLLLAWGYVGEEHCRYSAVRDPRRGWQPATQGCPDVRVVRDGEAVTGFAVRDARGRWLSPQTVS